MCIMLRLYNVKCGLAAAPPEKCQPSSHARQASVGIAKEEETFLLLLLRSNPPYRQEEGNRVGEKQLRRRRGQERETLL